jgi:hypothetical protein
VLREAEEEALRKEEHAMMEHLEEKLQMKGRR